MSNKVSVLLTIYNKPQWLRECIDSVVNQTYDNWELILLDDNSPNPEVQQIIDSYTDPRIVKYNSHVTEEDRYRTARYATMINYGFHNLATGEYITYLVDDDFYYPDRLQVLVEYMDANPTHEVVYHPMENVDSDGNPGGVRGVKGILDGKTDDTRAFNYVDHNMVMHTRAAFEAVGNWYDDAGVWGGADAYFWRHLQEKGYLFYPVGSNDHPLGAKRYHTGSVQWLWVDGSFWPNDRQNRGLDRL